MAFAGSAEGQPITVVVEEPVYLEYIIFLQGRDPLEIDDFSGQQAGRPAVEPILLQQALHYGGLDSQIIFTISPSYIRSIDLLKSGDYSVSGSTIWKADVEDALDNITLSDPIIDIGEYEAGMYVQSGNDKALSAINMTDIRQLTAVSNRYWKVDWRTLTNMGLRSLYSAPSWDSITSMIRVGRADLMLAPFPTTEDLSFNDRDQVLIPIPNIKVVLKGSRHFIIAKNHPHHDTIEVALKKGIGKMREMGRIRRTFEEVGVFNEKVKNWRIIN